MSRLPTVTVALSAFNEAKNIVPFLSSLFSQTVNTCQIEHIWLYDDGSNDRTVETIRTYLDTHPQYTSTFAKTKIEVISDGQRRGKSARLNQIYQRLTTDFLIQTDADVIFAHPTVIDDILHPLFVDEKVGMCGGDPQPLTAETFIEEAINLTWKVYAPFRTLGTDGDNVYSVDGRLLAYRQKVVKKIHVPEDMIANDAFTYYACLTQGFQYVYVASAVVFFRSPQTISDQIRQNTRFLSAPVRMTRYFDPTLVYAKRFIPTTVFWRSVITVSLRYPFHTLAICMVNTYCRLRARWAEKHLTAKWPIAFSTKKLLERSACCLLSCTISLYV